MEHYLWAFQTTHTEIPYFLQTVPKHSMKTMARLRELGTYYRGLLILHAAVCGQCAYHRPPPFQ